MASMRRLVGTGALIGAIVACEDGIAEEMGQMLKDAGALLSDAGDAQAQSDAGSSGAMRVVEQPCNTVRTVGPPESVEERFAVVHERADKLRNVWLCADPAVDVWGCSKAYPGSTCTGATPPKMKCQEGLPFVGEDNTLWVQCATWTSARFVFDE